VLAIRIGDFALVLVEQICSSTRALTWRNPKNSPPLTSVAGTMLIAARLN
jgi:hypothetical protein